MPEISGGILHAPLQDVRQMLGAMRYQPGTSVHAQPWQGLRKLAGSLELTFQRGVVVFSCYGSAQGSAQVSKVHAGLLNTLAIITQDGLYGDPAHKGSSGHHANQP